MSLTLLFKSFIKELEIDSASNGEEAIVQVEKLWNTKRLGYRIIMMDLNMPCKDGYQATRELKKKMRNDELPQTPIICNTAYSDRSQPLFDEVGFDDFIAKPIKLNELMEAINRL